MKRFYSAADLQQAHLLASLLREAGISCHVFNEHLQGGVGEIPFTQAWPELWLVNPADEARARAIVAAFEQPQPDEPARRCPGCGEENPANFETCWRCGDSLD